MGRKGGNLTGLGDAYKSFIKTSGIARRSTRNREILTAWKDAVDGEIRRHTRISSFRSGVLTVEVDTPARLSELASFRQGTILKNLKEKTTPGLVTGIRFSLAKRPIP